LEDWVAQNSSDGRDVIGKVEFTRKMARDRVLSELADLGLRRSTIYPDLANFVLEMKQNQGW
jgi:hypothetical protein